MTWLAKGFYDTHVAVETSVGGVGFNAEIVLGPFPRGIGRLQVKHCVQAVYEAGCALAAQPIERPGYAPRLYASLFVRSEQIGLMKWQQKTISNANTSIAVTGINSSTDLQNGKVFGGFSSKLKSGTIVNPSDNRFTIDYELSDKAIDYPEIFTTFLDALASAAPRDKTETNAFVNAISHSGQTVLNIHGIDRLSKLTWSRLIDVVTMLWLRIFDERAQYEMDFELYWEGEKFGEGWILSLGAPQAILAAS